MAERKFEQVCHSCSKPFISARRNGRVFCSETCRIQCKLLDARTNYKKKIYQLYHGTMAQAKYRNKDFNLSLGFIENLWEQQDGCCLISKIPFSWGGKFNPDAPSLDRIDSDKGYTQDNVRLITYHLNIAMNKFGLDQFKRLASSVIGGSIAR